MSVRKVKEKVDQLEQGRQFQHLGSMITSTRKCDIEICRRIGFAKKAFSNCKKTSTLEVLHVVGSFLWLKVLNRQSNDA